MGFNHVRLHDVRRATRYNPAEFLKGSRIKSKPFRNNVNFNSLLPRSRNKSIRARSWPLCLMVYSARLSMEGYYGWFDARQMIPEFGGLQKSKEIQKVLGRACHRRGLDHTQKFDRGHHKQNKKDN